MTLLLWTIAGPFVLIGLYIVLLVLRLVLGVFAKSSVSYLQNKAYTDNIHES